MKLSLASALAVLTFVSALPTTSDKSLLVLHDVVQSHPVKTRWSWGWLKPIVDTEQLQATIYPDALRDRAKILYNIAKGSIGEHGHPTRVIGSKGHTGTLDYILAELRLMALYYTVDLQKFDAIDGRVKSFGLLVDGVLPKLLLVLALTPATPHRKPVHARLVLADNYGCDVSDFPADIAAGNIVLVARGECSFGNKLVNAGKAGAAGVVIYDKEAPLHATLGYPTGDEVPTVSISTEDAAKYIDALMKNPNRKFETTLYVDSYVKVVKTCNIIAETRSGDHNNVVSLGAHSDSVAEGPGINDDGSGTISLLEVALQLTKFKVNNAVRFAWWAAEEEGLLGSYAYTNALTPEEKAKIRVFMDYDMMASPNYEYQIYDANNVDHPNGSGNLKELYIDWYTKHGLKYTLVPFDGRSDYVGFIDVGIPAGGIATGAEGIKTKEGEQKFGGEAGKAFDPCYHQLCDNFDNPDYEAWVINTKLIAHSVAVYAQSLGSLPARDVAAAAKAPETFSSLLKFRATYAVL
ncbi:Zn-dependent exopeptidase [Metschnikowia bicuspidata]|uniref:Peptide hydrolase n=1 Tax=Metschnikowia bicuspidata TaxID=27322 RepID=A0A4P9ZHF5_9ASCO|nr:Zn-dependent exopeptidase [Metschnikowia bicuspidata]